MGAISDLAYDRPSRTGRTRRGAAWRRDLLPAHFRGAMFHCESGSRENGRRIVVHEFPKRDEPYSEDMGRRAIEFTVRGYCITYPFDTGVVLYDTDYRKARDALIAELEKGGDGILQLPTLPPMTVVCQRYRLTEEEKLGGYCVFDMTFVEQGRQPFWPEEMATVQQMLKESQALRDRVKGVLSGLRESKTGRTLEPFRFGSG